MWSNSYSISWNETNKIFVLSSAFMKDFQMYCVRQCMQDCLVFLQDVNVDHLNWLKMEKMDFLVNIGDIDDMAEKNAIFVKQSLRISMGKFKDMRD